MTTPILQAAVGPDGAWEFWMAISTAELALHAARLVARAPQRWRIVKA
jgi:hypothetical protein